MPHLLSVCMIVKNEEQNLSKALLSVMPAADEIIVVDTGSTDSTIKRAKRFQNVRVVEHPIDTVQSFAELRNLSFREASGKYVMWLDAADQVGNAARLRQEVQKEASQVIAMQTVYEGRVFLRERVVPRGRAWFVDRVHETIEIGGLTCRAIDVPIYHRSHKNVQRENSLVRNVRLLRMMIDESPSDHARRPRWEYYLANDLLSGGQEEEALQHLRNRVEMHGLFEERMRAAILIASILQDRGDHQAAVEEAKAATKLSDKWREPYWIAARSLIALKKVGEAISFLQLCMQVRPFKSLLPLDPDLYSWAPVWELSKCYESCGDVDTAQRVLRKYIPAAPIGIVPDLLARIDELALRVVVSDI